jgi:hypothetical protein
MNMGDYRTHTFSVGGNYGRWLGLGYSHEESKMLSVTISQYIYLLWSMVRLTTMPNKNARRVDEASELIQN